MIQITFDQNKAESNKIKHGVSFDEAKIALLDPNALVREDFDHDETRFVLLGMANRLLVVVYCYVDNDDMIRLISARKATKTRKNNMQTEYDFSNAQRATQISHLNRLREQQHLLDKDVSDWLVTQDDDTKKHISEMIRQVMAMKMNTQVVG